MRVFRCSQTFKAIRKFATGRSRGATLVEVVAAIIVLGLLVASVPSSLIAITNYQNRQNEKRIAENLARNQIEYIKAQDYIWGNVTWPVRYDIIRPEINFAFEVEAIPLDTNYEPYVPYIPYIDTGTGNVTIDDDGMQEITIIIWGFSGSPVSPASARPVLEVVTYKTDYEGS